MKAPIQILHLEDNPVDAELIRNLLLAEGVSCAITSVCDAPGFAAALEQKGLQLILSDFTLPRFDGISALELSRRHRPEVPFIFISGTIGEEMAVDALKRGATDYVLKDRMTRLPAAIRRALQEAEEAAQRLRFEQQLRQSEERFQHLLSCTPAVIYSLKFQDGQPVPDFISDNITTLLWYKAEECMSPGWWKERLHAGDAQTALALLSSILAQGAGTAEYRLRHKDGGLRVLFPRRDGAGMVDRKGDSGAQFIYNVTLPSDRFSSLVALPPIPRRIFLQPDRTACAINSPVPKVVVASGSY